MLPPLPASAYYFGAAHLVYRKSILAAYNQTYHNAGLKDRFWTALQI